MFVLRSSISLQMGKKIFRIINKWGLVQINIGGGGRVRLETNSKINRPWDAYFTLKSRVLKSQIYYIYLNLQIDLFMNTFTPMFDFK